LAYTQTLLFVWKSFEFFRLENHSQCLFSHMLYRGRHACLPTEEVRARADGDGGGGVSRLKGGGGSHLSSDRRMPRALRGLPVLRLFFFSLAPLGHTVVLRPKLSRPAECLVVSAYLGVYAGMPSNRQLCFAHRCLVLYICVCVYIYTHTHTHICI